jgi:hypothetical protein
MALMRKGKGKTNTQVNYLGRSRPTSRPPTSKHGTQRIGKALKNENQKEIGNDG